AIAILISAVNALTLSPALCALFLRNVHHGEEGTRKKGFGARFFSGFNAGFTATTRKYTNAIKFLFKHKWIAISGLVLVTAVTFWMMKKAPTGFIPTEDQGFIVFSVNLPPGASLDRTQHVMDKVDSLLAEVEAVERRATITGLNILA